MRIKIYAFVVVVFITLFFIEILSFFGVQHLKGRLVFYNPPSIKVYDQYMAERDPFLGWPSTKMMEERYDSTGTRPDNFAPTSSACISLYGDSFTWGDGVTNEEAWGALLSKKLRCRVANYGVSGYGTDQALLRYERNDHDTSPVVVLNHFTGDIRRIITQSRNFTSDDDFFLLKPRFVLENGKLRLIPLPNPTRQEAELLISSPKNYLRYEYYLPDGESGVTWASFPYTLSLIRALNNEHLQSKIRGVPVWEGFYHPAHASGSFELLIALYERFLTSAKSRGAIPVITIIPNIHDVEYFQESGHWSYEGLLPELEKRHINIFDMGPEIAKALEGHHLCDFAEKGNCYGHYNAGGNKVIASIAEKFFAPMVPQQ